ncbi:MAG: PorT family protein [Chitinophagales bacterium]|nr:PorT family protein [Chitinophagales bacterium]
MNLKLLLLAGLMAISATVFSQYTPLPGLDKEGYDNFVAGLKVEADKQDLPELKEIAENMTYDKARRFLANPQVFTEKLRKKAKEDGDQKIEAVRIGLIVSILLNHFTNLGSSWNSSPRLGFALGMYAMFTFGNLYFLGELLFAYRSAGEKYSAISHILTISYITLFANLVYAIQMQNMKWLIGIGPVFALGIFGKEKYKDGSMTDEQDVEWGSGGLRRFQVGINILTGFMFARGMLVYLSYTPFISKLFDSAASDIRMNMFKLFLGFPLNNGRAK